MWLLTVTGQTVRSSMETGIENPVVLVPALLMHISLDFTLLTYKIRVDWFSNILS